MQWMRALVAALTIVASLPLHGATQVDFEALDARLDEFFAEQLGALDVPGAAVVVVKDGRIQLARGFGLANRSGVAPFAPDTIVRAGSIVGTVTALAALQLAETGQLDLDGDINQYISRFQVPATFAEPVTVRHLLHYTGGFDSRLLGVRTISDTRIMSLGAYLRLRMPSRLRPPGLIRADNDHEIALAALAVEEISGQDYGAYVRQHIFEPLEMTSSSLLLPFEDVQRAAVGYGTHTPYPFNYYYLHNAPGAGFNTTPADMANYMIMHLGGGLYGGRQVVSAETLRMMHLSTFTHHPELPGIALSFDEHFRDASRYIAKSGAAPGFMNRLMLFPEDDMGIYFVYNRDSTVPLASRLEAVLLDFLYPAEEAPSRDFEPRPNALGLERYAGRYVDLNGYSRKSIERLRSLTRQVLVEASPDGSLVLSGAKLKPVEPDLFRSLVSGDFVAFRSGPDDRVSHLFVKRTAYARLPWYETFEVQVGLLGFAVSVFFLCAVVWLYAVFRGFGTRLTLQGLMGVANLVFLGMLAYAFREAVRSPDPPWTLTFDPPLSHLATMALPFLGAALGAIVLVRAITNAGQRYRPFFSKLTDLPVILAEGGFLFFLFTWNLLGVQF